MKTTSRVVGIDLGTTYARVAVCQNDSVEIIHNDYGNLSTPSYVAFTDTETILGDSAKIQAVLNPLNTVFDAKRLIGLPFSNPEVQSDIKSYPFSIFGQVSFFDQFSILDLVSTPCIRVQDRGETREFTPEEILSMILAFLKETAEAYLGGTVTSAVVAVPAWFSFAQKQAVWRAATTSGLQVLRLVNENSCSAIAYCLDRARPGRKDNILILDIGGGGTNVSLTTVLDGVIEVKATTGVHHLGGEDFDHRLVAHLARQFKRKHNTDVTGDARALRRLHIACQRAKHTLSTASRTIIAIDSLCDGIDLYTSITRAEFETLCQDLFRSVLEPIEQVLWDARIDKSGVHELVLVGGSTRIPYIRNIVSDFFDGKQPAVLHPLDPETTVARGAAIQAAILTGNTSEKTQEMLLLDAIPHSLGIRTAGDVMTPLAKRNTTFPMKKTGTFSTTRDDQCDMVIEVYEGERARTKDNALLGRLWLSGIPPAPRGVPHIEVTFELDANESVSVSARDRNAGEESTLCLDIPSGSGELSDMKLATMVVADEEVARQTAAHTRLKTYTRDLRTALRDVDSALKDTEEWLESGSTGTSFATVEEYKTRESELYTVIVPAVLELWKEPEASDSPSSDEAREGAVDEEAVRRWVEARLPSTVEHSDVRGRP